MSTTHKTNKRSLREIGRLMIAHRKGTISQQHKPCFREVLVGKERLQQPKQPRTKDTHSPCEPTPLQYPRLLFECPCTNKYESRRGLAFRSGALSQGTQILQEHAIQNTPVRGLRGQLSPLQREQLVVPLTLSAAKRALVDGTRLECVHGEHRGTVEIEGVEARYLSSLGYADTQRGRTLGVQPHTGKRERHPQFRARPLRSTKHECM